MNIIDNIVRFLLNVSNTIGTDVLFFIALAVEALIVIFFLVKSLYSYEARLNRALEKINYWLFEKKIVSEENIKELNMLFKMKAPKRLCYYWQQYILFREGTPSYYLSTENLIEKPLNTSSYNSNIKNLTLFTVLWALISGLFILVSTSSYLSGQTLAMSVLVPLFVYLIGVIFVVYLRARKNSILNSLYQNTSLFGRFMDNACVDLPSYIDYQILFTPQEIENGQPVLREFLDYKARKEKEEFNKAKEEDVNYETYDFSSTGVDGSMVLDRAMKESELFLKKKEKVLLRISQLESELESRRKNFDNVQKDYQTKIQASKENVDRLRQMQEETTNRIESNYYRKQQTQEIAKQEQFEQEFEQQRARYMLEKNEGEEEINKLNAELDAYKTDVENAMMSEYQTFFDKFCKSTEKVVGKVFDDKIKALKDENEQCKEKISELEIKLKNIPHTEEEQDGQNEEGRYDAEGNFVYPNGTFYDKDGNFHDQEGNIYSQDGKLISKAPEKVEEKKDEKQVVDFDSFDAFDFMTDVTQKGDVYNVAENIVKDVDKDGSIEINNSADKNDPLKDRTVKDEDQHAEEADMIKQDDASNEMGKVVDVKTEDLQQTESVEKKQDSSQTGAEKPADDFGDPFADWGIESQKQQNQAMEGNETTNKIEANTQPSTPKKKAGRPRKVVTETAPTTAKRGRGRPKKTETVAEQPAKNKVGRPRKTETASASKTKPATTKQSTSTAPKKKAGRPRKIIKEDTTKSAQEQPKRGRGRPRKNDNIAEINKKLSEEEEKMNQLRSNLNQDLQSAMNELNSMPNDDKKSRRDQLIKEIDQLQSEAQQVIANNEPDSRIQEINSRLEALLDEIKKLN